MGRGEIKPHSASPKEVECLTGYVFAWLLGAGWYVARQCLISWSSRTKKKGTPFSIRRGRFLAMKRAFLYIKEGVSLYQGSAFVN